MVENEPEQKRKTVANEILIFENSWTDNKKQTEDIQFWICVHCWGCILKKYIYIFIYISIYIYKWKTFQFCLNLSKIKTVKIAHLFKNVGMNVMLFSILISHFEVYVTHNFYLTTFVLFFTNQSIPCDQIINIVAIDRYHINFIESKMKFFELRILFLNELIKRESLCKENDVKTKKLTNKIKFELETDTKLD